MSAISPQADFGDDQGRIKPLEGVRNFRDFGGYEGAGGRKVRRGILYRSGQFGDVSKADINLLETLNITVQADLRRPDERERHGHRWPVDGVNVLSSDKGRETDAPHVNFLNRVSVNADDARDWMSDYYRAAPYKEQHVDIFRDWFAALSPLESGQSAVVNCAAGKDRTGILCALTHHVLGVDRATIFEDYLLTNKAANVETRLPEMARMFNQHIGKDYPDAVYHPFVGVSAVFLEAAYDSIERQSGSLDVYLANTLGIGAVERDAMRARLLA